jgi:ATP-dependent Clp protease ATP-binding subunit ClpC
MKDRAFEHSGGSDENLNKIKNKPKSSTPTLDAFGKDLTKLAAAGKLDPVIGREEEIDKVVQILSKRKKNNPVLVGEPGVGKTAIAEGLAIRIVNKQVDRWLYSKRVIELNFTSIVSGTKYRGEFEQRMEEVMREVSENPDVIIFVDEFHNVIGAGGASGSMDAANIIKPALSRGEMRMIGATTLDEYKKIVESDGALERRFQKVYIGIPSKQKTISILNLIKKKYEDFHSVTYGDDVIKQCVDLADRYINYRNFPDKAIDILDEVGARVKLNNASIPSIIKSIEQELQDTNDKKKIAASATKYEEAAKFRDKEKELIAKIEEETLRWEEVMKQNKVVVKKSDVAHIISSHTGIPVDKLTDSENDKLISMEEYLEKRVIGQKDAVKKVCEAIQRSRVGIQDPKKPIASFIFLGSTGVGKTELAKVLADYMYNTDDSFIRIDMSEYGEPHSANKLIGALPGYIGYEEKGQLTERVKNRPYSLILLDEIEKAHPDVFNVLLQVLDDGELTDSTGVKVNFKNTIIIMTSNIGTDKLFNEGNLGFKSSSDKPTMDVSHTVLQELRKFFKPELINRIDEKVVFQPLTEDNILKIVDIELSKLANRLKELNYELSVAQNAKKHLADIGYDKDFGARPLKRAITTEVENVISKAILKKEIKEGTIIKLFFDKKTNSIVIK